MQIAVQQRLATREKQPFQLLHRDLQVRIHPKFGGDVIELRLGPAVEFGKAVRIGEHQLLGYSTRFSVETEHRLLIALSASRQREIRGGKQGLGGKCSDVIGQFWPWIRPLRKMICGSSNSM